MLGEASLNLADCIDYVQKEKSLLLMNGSVAGGTALHVSVLQNFAEFENGGVGSWFWKKVSKC